MIYRVIHLSKNLQVNSEALISWENMNSLLEEIVKILKLSGRRKIDIDRRDAKAVFIDLSGGEIIAISETSEQSAFDIAIVTIDNQDFYISAPAATVIAQVRYIASMAGASRPDCSISTGSLADFILLPRLTPEAFWPQALAEKEAAKIAEAQICEEVRSGPKPI